MIGDVETVCTPADGVVLMGAMPFLVTGRAGLVGDDLA